MSGFPLAALTVHPPEQPDTLGSMGKFMQLKALMNQEQLAPLRRQQLEQEVANGQQESQVRQMQVEQGQMGIASQKAMMKAYQDAEGDPDQTWRLAAKYGATPGDVFKLRTQGVEQQKANIELLKTKGDRALQEADLMQGAHDQVAAAPPEKRPTVYQEQLQSLANAGLDVSKVPPQYPGDDAFRIMGIGVKSHKAQLDELVKQQELLGKTADAQIKQGEAAAMQGGGVNPKVPIEVQEANSWLKLNPGKTLTDYQKYKATLVPAFNFNLQAKGVDGGNGAPPSGDYKQQIASFGPKGGVIKAIIEGRQDPPASFAQKSPYWQDVMQKVYSVDPDFNQQRAQLRKEFTVGKTSHEINAINTAMGHVGVLGDAIDALNNGDVRVLNSIANRFGVETGKDAVTTYNTIVHRVGPEISSAYLAAGGTAGERGSNENDFKADKGTAQLKNNVSITSKLLRSKISSLENQWDQNKAPSMPTFGDQFITKEAKQQLDKWSPQQGGGSEFSVKAPNGHTYTFKDQQSLDTFKKTAGLQ